MISRLLSFSIRAHWLVLLLTVVVAAYGAYELTRLPLDALPDITNKQVMINYSAPSLGPEDVEKRITFPIETAISGLAGVESTRSFSRNGYGQVTAIFRETANLYFMRQQVAERMAQAKPKIKRRTQEERRRETQRAILAASIALLTEKLTDARATLAQKKKETTEATSTHEQTLQDLQVKRERAIAERDSAERELTQRFVTAGTILNLNRVEHPKLAPLFARVDELKGAVNAREAAIVRLEAERRVYDRAAVQKGLMTVGIEGMSQEEAGPLLEAVFEHAENPEFVYEHVWRLGDLLLWDNRCSSHARRDFPSTERRLMLRTTVQGSGRPV